MFVLSVTILFASAPVLEALEELDDRGVVHLLHDGDLLVLRSLFALTISLSLLALSF